MRRALALGAVIAGLGATAPAAQGAPVRLVPVGGERAFSSPSYATAAPGDGHRLFVTELDGRVRVVRDGSVLDTPFLDLSAYVGTPATSGSEGGLLSLAFAPDYETSRKLYVFYSRRSDGAIVVAEHQRAPDSRDRAVAGAGRELLVIAHADTKHYGGQLAFGPDGMLYVSTGDDKTDVNAQDRALLLGKILRIDPADPDGAGPLAYGIPAGNPLAAGGGRAELWAMGLRNPWRFSFAPDGTMVIGDVGEATAEEIDLVPPGPRPAVVNFGWPCYEGRAAYVAAPPACTTAYPGPHVPPFLDWSRAEGSGSITGGYVVGTGAALPSLTGRYLYGDFIGASVRSMRLEGDGRADPVDDGPVDVHPADAARISGYTLVSFGLDACGRVHAVTITGAVYRLEETGSASDCAARVAEPPPADPVPTPVPVPIADGFPLLQGFTGRSARVTVTLGSRPLRGRRLTLGLRNRNAFALTGTATLTPARGRRLARRTFTLAAGARATLRLRLARAPARRARLALTVVVRDPRGVRRTVKRAFKAPG